MPASSTGGLPVRRVNAVSMRSPCRVPHHLRNVLRPILHAGGGVGLRGKLGAVGNVRRLHNTHAGAFGHCAEQLGERGAGPRSTAHNVRGSFSLNRFATCALQST